MRADEENYIKRVFPLLEKIKDNSLRDKVSKVWVRLWRESGYFTLEEAPKPGVKDTLIKHTNAVSRAAFALAIELQQEYELTVNIDILLAGALLHDVDMLVLYQKKESNVEKSDLGKKIPHGTYGGHIALEEELPTEVVNLIVTHSLASTWEPVNIEGIILHHADLAIYQAVSKNSA